MAFTFAEGVNPIKPIDKNFPAPVGFDVVDAYDYSQARLGRPTDLFKKCLLWQEAEIARITAKKQVREPALA
jgi:hypothetical protein